MIYCNISSEYKWVKFLMAATTTQTIEELVLQYKSCPNGKKKEALRLKIVEMGLGLVRNAVFKFGVKNPTLQEDLIQVGALGLIKAIDNYEIDKNASFSTYANYRIKGSIKHYLRDKLNYIRTPRRVQELVFKVYDAYNKLKRDGIDEITPDMLADYLDIEQNKIDDILNKYEEKSFVSLDQVSDFDEENIPLSEKISVEGFNEPSISNENQLIIKEAFDKLPEMLQKVIRMNFYEDIKQREIAAKLNISQMQVSRLIKKALIMMYDSIIKRT